MKKHLREYTIVFIGNLILAIGVGMIIIPGKILSGGLGGIAVALYPIFHLPEVLVVNFLQYAFFILGAITLGKKFAAKTLLSTILYPSFLWIINYFGWTIQIENPLLASIYGGILVGVGVGLAFSADASTGGVDILALIGAKYTRIPLATWVMGIDAVIVLLGVATYGVENTLVGILSIYASTVAVTKVITFGATESISLLIISDKYEEIMNEIHTTFDRGCTLLNAIGGYTRKEKPVVLVVIDKKEYPSMQRMIKEIDGNSFTIVNDTKEVHGEGFLQEFIS